MEDIVFMASERARASGERNNNTRATRAPATHPRTIPLLSEHNTRPQNTNPGLSTPTVPGHRPNYVFELLSNYSNYLPISALNVCQTLCRTARRTSRRT
eukprot:2557320-Lingulodinium_polyedra.AAC.1